MWLYPHPFFSKIDDLVAQECLCHAALLVAFVLVKDHSGVISPLTAGTWHSAPLLPCRSLAGSGQSLSHLSGLSL